MRKLHWENTNMPARHKQTENRPSGRRSPSKRNSVKKKRREKKGEDKNQRIVPDDIHVNIDLVFVRSKYNHFHRKRKKIATK